MSDVKKQVWMEQGMVIVPPDIPPAVAGTQYVLASDYDKLAAEVVALREAVEGLLAEPYGCPMCDSGKLRNGDKEHWDDCPYKKAKALTASQPTEG